MGNSLIFSHIATSAFVCYTMGRLFASIFLRQQFITLPTVDSFKANLSGKTVVVVGSNVGLGLETARHFATMMGEGEGTGRLILACRNVEKGLQALKCASVV